MFNLSALELQDKQFEISDSIKRKLEDNQEGPTRNQNNLQPTRTSYEKYSIKSKKIKIKKNLNVYEMREMRSK